MSSNSGSLLPSSWTEETDEVSTGLEKLSWADETEAEIQAEAKIQAETEIQAVAEIQAEAKIQAEKLVVPPSTVVVKGNTKIVTLYRHNDKGQLEKVVRTYRLEKRRRPILSEGVALRRSWQKFGDCAHDGPGVNPENTYFGETVHMRFLTADKESWADVDDSDEDLFGNLKAESGGSLVKCRICSGSHWSLSCPSKASTSELRRSEESITSDDSAKTEEGSNSNAYVSPALKGHVKHGASSSSNQPNEANSIVIQNLSFDTTEEDLTDLVKPFGKPLKVFILKEKLTGMSRGIAFVTFKNKADAAAAIKHLNGYGYDHLILKAWWKASWN